MNVLLVLARDWFQLVRSARARPFLLIALFTDGAFLFLFLVAIQSYLPDHGSLGAGLPGYTLAVYGGAKLAAQLVAGRLIDRLGSTRAVQLGLVVIAAGQAAMLAGAVAPLAVLPTALVYGAGSAIVWPGLYARASQRFPEEERAKMGAAFTVTTFLSLILGLSLGLLLPGHFPYAGAVLIVLAAGGLALAAAAMLRPIETGDVSATHLPEPASLRAVFAVARDPARLRFAAFLLLEAAAIGSLQAIFRSYGRDVLDVSFREQLFLLAPAAALGAGGIVIGGSLSDRLGRLQLLGFGFTLAGLALWPLSTVTDPAAVVPLAAIGGLGAGMAMPSIAALSMDLSRTAGQGTVLSWFMMVEGLGHAAGAGLGGWINSSADPAGVLKFAGAALLALGLGALASFVWESASAARRGGGLANDAVGSP